MKIGYRLLVVIAALLVIPLILLTLVPTSALKVSVRWPTGLEQHIGPVTVVISTTGDIMTLSEFFGSNPLLAPIVIILLAVGLIFLTLAVIQTWNLSSLVARGDLWEDWRFTAFAIAALLYAGYITLICFVWGIVNNNFSIFNNPIFLIPVIASLITAPILITISFYRFRKKAEEFIRTIE